jgi:secondary thiamine-phosphate synthase enzyme
VPLQVKMRGGTHIENITALVQQALSRTGLRTGIVTVFARHTTASVLIIEDEPGIRADTKTIWDRLVPADPNWQHNTKNPGEDNAHSHLRGQLQGPSLTVPFNDGTLTLGTWQQVVVVDFDTRARTRDLVLQVIGE